MADRQWEYATDELKSGLVAPEILDEWGASGWELVAVIPNQPMSIGLIFKREKAPDYSFLGPKIEATVTPDADGAQRPEPQGEGS